ncbi:MAG: hypothetical protein RR585_13435 [Coprobacillus sp.]
MKHKVNDVLEKFNYLGDEVIDVGRNDNQILKTIKEDNPEDFQEIEEFIKQYLPPSFDEVVKSLREVNGEFEIIYDHNDNSIIAQIPYEETDAESEIDSYFLAISLESVGGVSMHISKKELEAINLAIRYLESKKEKENE